MSVPAVKLHTVQLISCHPKLTCAYAPAAVPNSWRKWKLRAIMNGKLFLKSIMFLSFSVPHKVTKLNFEWQNLSFNEMVVEHNKCSHTVTEGFISVAWLLLGETFICSRGNVLCFAAVTGEASVMCRSPVWSAPCVWVSSAHHWDFWTHSYTHTADTFSCVLGKTLPSAGLSWHNPDVVWLQMFLLASLAHGLINRLPVCVKISRD